MMTRIDGAVSRPAEMLADGAGAAASRGVAGTALPGAAAAGRAASVWSYQPVLPAWPRSGTWLITAGPGEIARPRGYAPEAAASAAPTGASETAASPKATVTSPLDFLRDSRLTAEEKLVLLLAQQQKDVEKEIETVLKKAEAKSAKKTSGGGVLKKLKLTDFVKSAVPGLALIDDVLGSGAIAKAVVQLSGPVLAAGATALGMPHLAPLALSAGPELLGAALDAELPVTAGEAKATANAPSAGTGSSTALDPVETQRLTLLVNRQQQWAGTVSNLLHSQHQTRMNLIQNLR